MPNVITAPMPKHDKGVNVVEDTIFIASIEELTTPLNVIKSNLLKAGIFPGCEKDCAYCIRQPNGCEKLKKGI